VNYYRSTSSPRCCSFCDKELTGIFTKPVEDIRIVAKPKMNTRPGFFYDRLIAFYKERLNILFNSAKQRCLIAVIAYLSKDILY